MPKVAVISYGAAGLAGALADAVAEGVASTRFMEVDRWPGSADDQAAGRAARAITTAESLRGYDGVVIACEGAGDVPRELAALLDEWERLARTAPFQNTVFAVTAMPDGDNTTILGRVNHLGGIIVSGSPTIDDPVARATALGARVSKVVGWVRHALSHDHHH